MPGWRPGCRRVRTTPASCLIKLNGHSAEYWDTPGGRIASVISFVKAKVTGERYEGGDNEKVTL